MRKSRFRTGILILAAAGITAVCAGCTKQQPAVPETTVQTAPGHTVTIETEAQTTAAETAAASAPTAAPRPTAEEEPQRKPGGGSDGPIVPFPEQGEHPQELKLDEDTKPPYDADDLLGNAWKHNLILGTDIHYLAKELTDGGPGFQHMVNFGDGKVVTYIEQITDAFLEEVIRKKPEVLILSGDLTLDGEKKSHEELAEKLYAVEKAGIPVLVIPGNHDINNRNASQYIGADRKPAQYTTPEEFRAIYKDFGYKEAVSRDRTTLSYAFDLDPQTRFLMIDSCQYTPRAKVGGAILADTYDWIEEMLDDAWENRMNVIPVAHHNLLDESEIYVEDCTIEHGEQLARMLESWDIPFFLSGHLHVQHAKRSAGNKGVWEMVTASLATPQCQYGVLGYDDDGSFAYITETLDVQSWARVHHRKESDLLNFNKFKEPFLKRVFYNQSYDGLEKVQGLTKEQRIRMSNLYAQLNYHYYQGDAYRIRRAAEADPDFELWLEEGGGTQLGDYVVYILEDAERDYTWTEAN